jgi:hypothetical protein
MKKRRSKKQTKCIIFYILISFLTLSTSGLIIQHSTIPINNGTLSGYVNNTSMQPIKGALVRVYFHGTYEQDFTDSSGYYHVTNIPICNCTKRVIAAKGGYQGKEVFLNIYENTTYDFILKPVPESDLHCWGDLIWTNVSPGKMVQGAILW